MDEEHLAVWQIEEFILGGLDDDELEAVCLHFDECADCLEWLVGGHPSRGVRVNAGRGSKKIKRKEINQATQVKKMDSGGLY